MAQKTELPISTIAEHNRLLGDLHLNSISVSQLVIDVARNLNLNPPASPTDYANATIAEVAQGLEELAQNSDRPVVELTPLGVDSWIRTFTVELVAKPLKSKQILPQDNLHNQLALINKRDQYHLPPATPC